MNGCSSKVAHAEGDAGCFSFSRQFQIRVPGSKAGSYEGRKIFRSLMRHFVSSKSGLGRFARSLVGLSREPLVGCTRSSSAGLPMPLPFPEMMRGSPLLSQKVDSLKCGVNGIVLVLNYLHLGQPSVAPSCLRLGNRLSAMQWRAVELLKRFLDAWVIAEVVDPVSMGRSASKVESIEEALADLETRAKSLASDGVGAYLPSLNLKDDLGLSASGSGEVVGSAAHGAFSTFKEIEPSRLSFVGRPVFNPSPFLDSRSRRVFELPLTCSLPPDEFTGTVPLVKFHCSRSQKIKLFELLDQSGRLSLHKEEDVRTRYSSGMFAVVKSMDRDRLIMDSRPPNCLEIPMQRWIKSLASAESLCQIRLSENEILKSSGNDVRDYYHMFVASDERRRRNILTGAVHPSEVRHLSCYSSEFDKATKVFGALATLAMGDAQAVEIAQTCHLGMSLQAGVATQRNLLNLAGFHPRSRDLVGLVIDDYVSMSIVDKSAVGPTPGAVLADTMEEKYESVGLLPHKDKAFRDEEQSTFWGVDLDGRAGLIRGSLKRAIPIMGILLRTAKLGVATVGLIQILSGSIVSLFLFRRRFLSVLDYLYRSCRGREDADIVKLSGRTISEILVAASLIPVAVTNLRAKIMPRVCASDASGWGTAGVVASAPIGLVSELRRHSLRKSVWSRLLSPSQAWSRMHEMLDPEDELPGEKDCFRTNPLWLVAAKALDYELLYKEANEKPRHINVSEVLGFLKTERILGKQDFSTRDVYAMDSQVGLGCLIKGRSSSRALNAVLSKSIGQMVIFDLYQSFIYYDTSSNPADDPTRGAELRKSSMALPSWVQSLIDGDFGPFDDWASSVGLGYFDMTGLPPFSELLGEDFFAGARDESSAMTSTLAESVFPDHTDNEVSEIESNEKLLTRSCEISPADTLAFEASLGSAAEDPATRECFESLGARNDTGRESEDEAELETEFVFFSVRGPLSPELSLKVKAILEKADSTQLLCSPDEVWPSSVPGFVDLVSGERGVAKELHAATGRWVITFDIIYGANQDLNDDQVRSDIEFLLEVGAVLGLGAAPVCRSFSVAVTPPIRSKEFPYGVPNVSQKVQASLDDGNQSARWVFRLVEICLIAGIPFWLENPMQSLMAFQDPRVHRAVCKIF